VIFVLEIEAKKASQEGLVFREEANTFLTQTAALQYMSVYKQYISAYK